MEKYIIQTSKIKKTKRFNFLFLKLIIIFLKIILANLECIINIRNLKSYSSIINLIIQGSGTQEILQPIFL